MGDSPSVFKSFAVNPLACTSAILCVSPRARACRRVSPNNDNSNDKQRYEQKKREKVRARSKSPETVNYKWECPFVRLKYRRVHRCRGIPATLSCWPPCLTKIDTYYLRQAVRPKQNRDYLATRRTTRRATLKCIQENGSLQNIYNI